MDKMIEDLGVFMNLLYWVSLTAGVIVVIDTGIKIYKKIKNKS